jgi:hypothetical protein
MIGPSPVLGPVIRCRRPTDDAKGLCLGDYVYVDFAGFVYDGAFVDRRMKANQAEAFAAKMMGLRPGVIVRERRFLWWRLGPEVALTIA